MVSVLLKDFGIDTRSGVEPSSCAVRGLSKVSDVADGGLVGRRREIRVSEIGGEVSVGSGMMAFRTSECGFQRPCFETGSDQRKYESRVSPDFGSGGSGRKFVARVSPDESRRLHASGRKDAEAAGGQMSRESSSLAQCSFEFGDMVWAKVTSHPWWPGYIFDDAFASASVKLTRRDGHVLVAFFGDSSYGWFDPAELIPFDIHYEEKSMEATSRDFMNAVDEAVDEMRRRRALGLVCRCRNPFNFRPASVKGYSVVDVDCFEPGGVYTMKQISNARDDFQPVEMLSFLQNLALSPGGAGTRDFDWIKRSAQVVAYRRAVFEEFDLTYAQAFGVEPILPTRNAMGVLELPNRVLPQALLSGLLVKSKGTVKNSSRPVKSRDRLKKKDKPREKYLFKKRGLIEARAAAAKCTIDGYVLQKRPVTTQEGTGREPKSDGQKLAGADVGLASRQHKGTVLPTSAAFLSLNIQAVAHGTVPGTGSSDSEDLEMQLKFGAKEEKNAVHEISGRIELDGGLQRMNRDTGCGSSGMMVKLESSETSQLGGDFQQHDQVGRDVQLPSGTPRSDGLIKREKRPREDSTLEMKEKKKKKKDLTLAARKDDQFKSTKIVKDVEPLEKSAIKSIGIASEHSTELSSKPLIPMPELKFGSMMLELPDLMNDLLALAVDPSHGIERGTPAIAQQFFLKFRSLVYRKSCVLPPPIEPQTLVGTPNADKLLPESGSGSTNNKPSKHLLRPDDPTKSGQKRSSSDRQEEMSVKRQKRLNEIKAMAAGGGKVPPASSGRKEAGMQKGQEKGSFVPSSAKLIKPESAKKAELQGSSATPTSLLMKFPPQTSLPSIMHLKAKFARFGQIDQDATRVYWNTWMCKVVFKSKADAQAAYNHAIQSKSLFGHVEVSYRLKEHELAVPEVASEASKQPADDAFDASQLFRPASNGRGAEEPRAMLHQQGQLPVVQLKSCLKKTPDSGAHTRGVIKETLRVKFQIGDDENNSRSPKLAAVSNKMVGNALNPSLSMALDSNSTVMKQTALVPPLQPNLSRPEQGILHSEKPHHWQQQQGNLPLLSSELVRKKTVDISYQMLGLLMKCNDIVSDLKNKLGYVPYHVL